MSYLSLSKEALLKEKEACLAELKEIADKGLSLDLSRGKPSKEQLSLSLSMLDTINRTSILDSESGQDCTNYGGLDGIPEAKRLFADMMGTHAANTLIGGNSSHWSSNTKNENSWPSAIASSSISQ